MLFLFAGLLPVLGFGMCSGAVVALLFLWSGEQCPRKALGSNRRLPGAAWLDVLDIPSTSPVWQGALRLWKAPVKAVSSLCEWTGACLNRFSL